MAKWSRTPALQRKTVNRICLFLLFASTCFPGSLSMGQDKFPLRTWKDITGEFSVKAELIGARGELVVLRREDQKEITVRLSQLSPADREYLKQLGPLPESPSPNGQLDSNLKCIDLSDLTARLPLKVTRSKKILKQSEPWEHSTWKPGEETLDSVGYPSVVKNNRGKNPDNKYYMYYAHHEPTSGIGCAVAEKIDGPYRKLAVLDESRKHSMVLVNPHSPGKAGDPSHYSTPSVVWNQEEKLWFMYFHYYNHFHRLWEEHPDYPGGGNQMTALATSPDLSSHRWTIVKDKTLAKVSVHDILPVMPTTKEPWMYGTSSYHTVQRLPAGKWLAFLRGTSAKGLPTAGFAESLDGRTWKYFAQNPVLRDTQPNSLAMYRPGFVGYLGKDSSGTSQYLVVWSESKLGADVPKVRYGVTSDFVLIRPDPRGFAEWPAGDGSISPWREGKYLYLFSGKYVHVMRLPVAKR